MPDVRAGIYRVVLQSRANDQVGVNVHHFLSNAAVVGYTELTLAQDIFTYIKATIKPLLSINATFEKVTVQHLFDAPVSASFVSTGAPEAGTDNNDLMARQVSGIISWYSDVGGPGGRGRTYVPFPSELNNTAAGHPTVVYQGLLADHADAMFPTMIVPKTGGGNITLTKVISVQSAAVYKLVTTYLARGTWATQKRRGDYGRKNL